MKMTTLILLVALMQASARGFGQRIILNESGSSLKKVLHEINKQTGYVFFYDSKDIRNVKITTQLKDASISETLNELLKKLPLQYKIVDKTIILQEKGNLETAMQELVVTGHVVDEKGEPLPGVSIKLRGTTLGTVTGVDGNYRLAVPDGTGTLVFSFIGYLNQEIPINNTPTQNVTLQPNVGALKEVVVTALGIERSTNSLTYDVQKIDASDVNVQKDANFVADLQGKVAGATVNASASGAGGSVRVVLRGVKSITANNNALYVVDGIPLQDLRSGQPGSSFSGGDTGEGISSINPDDIASISVLSGPSAAALYGFKGANGVILITTKKGRTGKTTINYSSNAAFSDPFVLPKFQDTYGAVPAAAGAGPTFSSYGAKLATPSSYNVRDFFNTGAEYTNSISITSGSEKTQNYFSAGSVNSSGIIQNNKYNRYNFTDRITTTLIPDKLTLDVSAMYVIEQRQNPVVQGQYNNPLVGVYLFPPGDAGTYNIKDYARFDPTRNFDTQYWPFGDLGLEAQNPYWIVNKEFSNLNRNRFLGSAALKYTIIDGLTLTGRVKFDNANDNNISKDYASTISFLAGGPDGSYSVSSANNKTLYSDLLLNYTKKFNNFSLTAVLGGSFEDDRTSSLSAGGPLSLVPNFFSLTNISQTTIGASSQPQTVQQNQALFATAQLGYKNYLFLDVTGRNDWNSALAYTTNKSIFYPSVGLSGVISEMTKLPEAISYAKVRVSYAEVGNSPPQYLSYPLNGLSNGTVSTISAAPFTTLTPENTKSIEAGVDLRFFNNAVNFSATYYSSRTFNQIFNVAVPPATGYSSYYINAGQINNHGIEATLGYTLRSGSFSWNPNVVFSLNRNKVAKLLKNYRDPYTGALVSQDTVVTSSASGYEQRLVVGGSTSDIYVLGLVKDADGNIELNANGLPVVSQQHYTKIGSSDPRYTLGFNNKFTYGNFNLSFLVNARVGGTVVSATQALLDSYGVSQTSANARNAGGVLVNGQRVDTKSYYGDIAGTSGGSGAALALYAYSATNVRLGELAFGYTFPGTMFNNTIKSINVSFVARNLWMIYNKAPFDPESTASTGTFYQGFDYLNQPSLRSLGVRLNVSL